MKSLKKVGSSLAGRWSRWVLSVAFAASVVGCGGGSDPLGIGGESTNSGGTADLRAAYDRITCGMTIEQAREAVGVEESNAGSTWIWYQVGVNSDSGELDVHTVVGDYGAEYYGFPADGIRRAQYVYYSHGKNGVYIHRDLCK